VTPETLFHEWLGLGANWKLERSPDEGAPADAQTSRRRGVRLGGWRNVTGVGCDEMSVRKGHRDVSVFCDLPRKRGLFAVKDRDKKVWEASVQALEALNGHPRAIREVSMDMGPSYNAGVRETIGSQAVMVFNKFHVIARQRRSERGAPSQELTGRQGGEERT
jgi:hypothetical protein